eukprot:g3105.t1
MFGTPYAESRSGHASSGNDATAGGEPLELTPVAASAIVGLTCAGLIGGGVLLRRLGERRRAQATAAAESVRAGEDFRSLPTGVLVTLSGVAVPGNASSGVGPDGEPVDPVVTAVNGTKCALYRRSIARDVEDAKKVKKKVKVKRRGIFKSKSTDASATREDISYKYSKKRCIDVVESIRGFPLAVQDAGGHSFVLLPDSSCEKLLKEVCTTTRSPSEGTTRDQSGRQVLAHVTIEEGVVQGEAVHAIGMLEHDHAFGRDAVRLTDTAHFPLLVSTEETPREMVENLRVASRFAELGGNALLAASALVVAGTALAAYIGKIKIKS